MARFDTTNESPGFHYMRSGAEGMNGLQPSSPPSYSTMQRRDNAAIGTLPLAVPRKGSAEHHWPPTGPNRSDPAQPAASFSLFNHHRPSPPPASPLFSLTERVDRHSDRDTFRATHSPIAAPVQPPALNTSRSTVSTLWWGELEPWMDEEYAKQVCALMGWDPLSIKVPHPAPDPTTGHHANNPGYCFLTFPSVAHASAVLSQVNSVNGGPTHTMPNSSKPFVLNWASTLPSATTPISASYPTANASGTPQYPKEFSIFVGDLAPETSNSDLVAVFRNPVLGLRNDREPKFIRPFLSCKSAKIMLDPVTGVSRGYGFVRFTDEADQQRALVEMHGLYCLSRPMRISPATAKFKPSTMITPHDLPQVQFPASSNGSDVTVAVPLLSLAAQAKSVSAPIAAATSHSSLHSTSSGSSSSMEGFGSGTTLSSNTSAGSLSSNFLSNDEMLNLPNHVLAQIARQYASGERDPPKPAAPATSITSHYAQERSAPSRMQDPGSYSEESWKHHAQAQAILGNLIGPNGEQLTSTDPYNTTVFVGGLSPLISEETLRTFFAPFGDIHYVKVPVGKHCGFVQFVRKADAERAIEKMQGFPVGGSRIRLSWGRSQYKAAQAAAQAAQTAAFQSHVPPALNPMAQAADQLRILQLQMKLMQSQTQFPHVANKEHLQSDPFGYNRKGFSPFSPELGNLYRRDSYSAAVPPISKDLSPFYHNDLEIASHDSSKTTPTGSRPSVSRYGSNIGTSGSPPRAPGRLGGHQELDMIHDLNGTLASLDLDRDRPWQSPAESSDSGASVQFQMTMNPPQSP